MLIYPLAGREIENPADDLQAMIDRAGGNALVPAMIDPRARLSAAWDWLASFRRPRHTMHGFVGMPVVGFSWLKLVLVGAIAFGPAFYVWRQTSRHYQEQAQQIQREHVQELAQLALTERQLWRAEIAISTSLEDEDLRALCKRDPTCRGDEE